MGYWSQAINSKFHLYRNVDKCYVIIRSPENLPRDKMTFLCPHAIYHNVVRSLEAISYKGISMNRTTHI
jgi:hypothetical protein